MSQMGRENFVYTNKDESVRTPYFTKQLAKSSNNLANYCFLLANFIYYYKNTNNRRNIICKKKT